MKIKVTFLVVCMAGTVLAGLAPSRPELEWLRIAKQDYNSAVTLWNTKGDFAGIVAYHAQQTAEKSLKAFLLAAGVDVERTHNLPVLLQQCIEIDTDFENLYNNAEILNPYNQKTRYPNSSSAPLSRSEAQGLMRMAKDFLTIVEKKL